MKNLLDRAGLLLLLLGLCAISVQIHNAQKQSIGRHAETLRMVEENRQLIDRKSADRFTRSDAIKYHLIPATQPAQP